MQPSPQMPRSNLSRNPAQLYQPHSFAPIVGESHRDAQSRDRSGARLPGVKGLRSYVATIEHFAFDISEANFGRLWPNRFWLLLHITGGTAALFAGPFQLWSGLRNSHRRSIAGRAGSMSLESFWAARRPSRFSPSREVSAWRSSLSAWPGGPRSVRQSTRSRGIRSRHTRPG